MTATTRTPHTVAGRRAGLRVRSRRLALIGAVVVLGLTACGTDDDAATGSPASSLPAPAVIEVAGAGGSGGNRAGAPASMDAATESSKIMPAFLTYEWAGGSVDLSGPAASWFFAPGVEPTVEQVEALAAAFGVSGEVTELAPDMGDGWTVGPTDGSAPSVTVGTDAMQSWWYSPAWNTAPAVVECVEPVVDATTDDGDATGAAEGTAAPEPAVDPCVPQPPANVPSADEARALATELFESLGVDLSQYELDVYADEWGAYVGGSLLLEGVRTNLTVNVGFGEDGAVTWAGGFLATPQRGADYPRIGVEAAVQRLNDQSAAWMTGSGSAVSDMARTDTVVAGASAEAAPAPVEETVPAEQPAEQPAEPPAGEATTLPADVTTPPSDDVLVDPPLDCTDPAVSCLPDAPVDAEPIVVTLTGAEASLEQVWAADGTVWLLPGYSFTGDEGMLASVLAVEDQYLVQAEPEPVPLPEPMPVETAVAGSDVPVEDGEAPFDDSSLIGLDIDEATKLAESQGRIVRVVREDGADLAVTADFVDNRVNVAVEGGVVTEVLSVG